MQAKFVGMKFANAYEAKHLKAHEPAKHLKAHEPAKHLKAPDISKTPAWATVIAGTGVAVTLVGATTGQFHGIISPNQSAVGQKPATNSAVRQLLNATNTANASSAVAKHGLSHAVHQARSATPNATGNVSRALTSKSTTTLRVGSTVGSPAHLQDEHLVAGGTTLLAAGTTTAPSVATPVPTSAAQPTTTSAQAAPAVVSSPSPSASTVATTTISSPTQTVPNTVAQPSALDAGHLMMVDEVTYSSSSYNSDEGAGHKHHRRHVGATTTTSTTSSVSSAKTAAATALVTTLGPTVATTVPFGPPIEEAPGTSTNPPIAPVGAPVVFSGDLGGASAYQLAVSPQNARDLLVLTVINDWSSSVTDVSGGGVSQWTEASAPYMDAADGKALQVWFGVVTDAGPAQVDVTWSGAAQNADLAIQEFSAGTDPTWSLYDAGSSSEPFPSLSGPATDEAYVGAATADGDAAAGPDSGVVYTVPNDDFVFAVATGPIGEATATGAGSVAALFGATEGTAGPSDATTATTATTSVSPTTVGTAAAAGAVTSTSTTV